MNKALALGMVILAQCFWACSEKKNQEVNAAPESVQGHWKFHSAFDHTFDVGVDLGSGYHLVIENDDVIHVEYPYSILDTQILSMEEGLTSVPRFRIDTWSNPVSLELRGDTLIIETIENDSTFSLFSLKFLRTELRQTALDSMSEFKAYPSLIQTEWYYETYPEPDVHVHEWLSFKEDSVGYSDSTKFDWNASLKYNWTLAGAKLSIGSNQYQIEAITPDYLRLRTEEEIPSKIFYSRESYERWEAEF